MFKINGKYTTALITIDNVEQQAISQIYSMVNHPAATNPIVIMPDTHLGTGCVIGFTMKMSDKVVPNWIGVDIGCGMNSVQLNIKNLENKQLAVIDSKIRQRIPLGKNVHSDTKMKEGFIKYLGKEAEKTNSPYGMNWRQNIESNLNSLIKKIEMKEEYFYQSIGTLGGGNHFIEFGKDNSEGYIWATVHSGSRNFGKKVCDYFSNKGQEILQKVDCSSYIEELKKKANNGEIKKSEISKYIEEYKQNSKLDFDVKNSAYVEGKLLNDYLEAMFVAQCYASYNRKMMMENIVKIISEQENCKVINSIDSIHNYISFRDGMVRKGAISSYENELMIIPFNMRDGLLICQGKSNADWNFSAPHGAGRVLSRSQAKAKILLEDYQKSMDGIFTTSVDTCTLDESPFAYKDASMIEEAIEPTAKIVFKVKPVYNIKAGE
jgi:RNA-splicing ligase RtcB